MFLQSLAIYKDVVEVDDHESIDELPQDVVHQPHEGGRSFHQPKGHDKPFVKPKLRLECRLSFISFLHPDLVVATPKINLAKDRASMQLVQHVI